MKSLNFQRKIIFLELSFDNKFKQSPKAGLDFNPSIDTLKITLKNNENIFHTITFNEFSIIFVNG